VSEGISPRLGLVAIWCQFAQTTFYYPAVLAYVASTLAYVFAPGLAHSGLYTTVVIIVLFWAAVLVSARGVLSTGRLASYGIFIGTLIPGLLLVILAAIYLLQGHASAAPLNVHHALPAWNGLTSIVLIVNGFFTYAGVEVNAVHVDELRDAPREFPKATLLAVILILCIFILHNADSPMTATTIAAPNAARARSRLCRSTSHFRRKRPVSEEVGRARRPRSRRNASYRRRKYGLRSHGPS
jgi:glutamate:GABA antiporter